GALEGAAVTARDPQAAVEREDRGVPAVRGDADAMKALDFDPSTLGALVLTHEHVDHCRGADRLAHKLKIPVYATPGTLAGTRLRQEVHRSAVTSGILRSGEPREIAGFLVEPFSLPHDAREPIGMVVEDPLGRRVGLVADVGCRTSLAWGRLQDVDVLILEKNHDLDMLRNGPYPWSLKQRIAGRHGHLSNHDAADGLPELMGDRLPDPETAAFHEAFSDCSSLLVTLGEPAVRRAFLDEAGRSLRSSNLVSRLAEALGRAIHNNYGPGALSDPTRLRDANNRFRHADPRRLPPRGSDDTLTSEPHSLSRVFSGAFYHFVIGLLAEGVRGGGGEELVEVARRRAGRLLARAVETLPPGEARFGDLAGRMAAIDREESSGGAGASLRRAFARHGIRIAAPSRGAPSRYASLRALDPDRSGGAAALRAALGLPPRARLARSSWPARVGGGIREQWVHRHAVEVRPSALGLRGRAARARSVVVDVTCGCTLTRDPSGDVEGMTIRPRVDPTPREVASWLRPWIRRDALAWREEAAGSSAALFRRGKVFRIGAGNRLERVYAD
ncbi:MAG TPA: MBL fold metallo-hydrolase, partial [Acidobacteriota bacterium]|nr:MBL fold metallo-hydrolase [Acidobacteriota bacterium]